MSYLHEDEFVPHAPLAVGEQVHVNHEGCEAGTDRKKRLYIKRNEGGIIVAYCHHCSKSGVHHEHGKTTRKLSTLRKMYGESDFTMYSDNVIFPKDTSFNMYDWPTEAITWVCKYISITQILEHQVGYSANMRRVILPVFDDRDILVFWQARAVFPEDKPKYVSFSNKRKPFMFLRTSPPSKKWVIVEDILSAIVCSEIANVVGLLGTSVGKEVLTTLKKEGVEDVYIWLDNDTAGWKGKHKAKAAFDLILPPTSVHLVTWEQQPKETPVMTIKELLK